MIQIFTKQNYIRRIGRGGAFGGYDGDGNGVGGGGEGFAMGLYLCILDKEGFFCFRGSHLTNDGGFLHFRCE